MDTSIDTATVLTVAQAAEQAGVSSKTIRRWIHANRLEAGRAGEAYVITAAALQVAMDWTPSIDTAHVLSVAPRHVESTSTLSSDLLDRLERQAQRIGQLEAELAQAHEQLRMLDSPKTVPGNGLANGTVEPTGKTAVSPQRAPWWAPWRRVSA